MRMREKRIELKLSDSEYAEIEKQAKRTGMTRTQLIRQLIMGNQIRARPPEEYLKLVRAINAIGNNINQIARVANAQKYVDREQIKHIVDYLDEIMEKVREIE